MADFIQDRGAGLQSYWARSHTGETQAAVTALLSERFDEQGADLINDGVFRTGRLSWPWGATRCSRLPCIFFLAWAPSALTYRGSHYRGCQKAVRLLKGTAFNPYAGMAAFFVVHAQVSQDQQECDAWRMLSIWRLLCPTNAFLSTGTTKINRTTSAVFGMVGLR